MQVTGNEASWKNQQFTTKKTFTPGGAPPRGGPPTGGARPGGPQGLPPGMRRGSNMSISTVTGLNKSNTTVTTVQPTSLAPAASQKQEPKVEAKPEPASNIPKAPPIEHFHCWVRGVPFGAAATTDLLNLPEDGAKDLDISSHASFNASDGEDIVFNPPKQEGSEMSLADQLAAQANRLKPAGS